MEDCTKLLTPFSPISLEEMDEVQLMDRKDSKFLTTIDRLQELLETTLDKGYRILEINGTRLFSYRTRYLDTCGFDMLFAHHNCRAHRYKIRFREYIDSRKSFLEIKYKDNKKKTFKKRISGGFDDEPTDEKLSSFIQKNTNFKPEFLVTKLYNTFSRFTLVNTLNKERVTFDLSVQFSSNGDVIPMRTLLIIEVKQENAQFRNNFREVLDRAKIRETGFSKYCLGVILLYPNIRYNRFKKQVLNINKICNDCLSIKHR